MLWRRVAVMVAEPRFDMSAGIHREARPVGDSYGLT